MTSHLDISHAARDERPTSPPKVNLAGVGLESLRATLEERGVEPRKVNMRARQLWRWVYHYGVRDFSGMTDIGKDQRAAFADWFELERPNITEALVSVDGTRKWLIEYGPNTEAETVFIPDVGRAGALCVSSQVGCTLNCTFCHTGTQKLVRNLTSAEIVRQVMVARDALDEWPTSNENRKLTNIVFMGMGEPLYNLDNVCEAIDTISHEEGISFGRRRITVSTAGVAPLIPELGKRTNAALAISLHATNDDLRNEIVPINKKYDLQTLFEAIKAYPGLGNSKKVTFEYVMLKGVNDSIAEAKDLIRLLKGVPAKINLIPFNPWPGSQYECSDWETIENFAEVLNRAGYSSPIRTPRGRDILAACGQLRSESVKQRASERRKAELAAKAAEDTPAE
ncbi:MAG: 23S rRNA (adenine(2503)-C(2))-methyltransferase RlmN [Ponticaulis sp.]|nr:23S rRNA (adenine(2503)-C(2))-methyltransferase RlmN [Ponticaulis sp.]